MNGGGRLPAVYVMSAQLRRRKIVEKRGRRKVQRLPAEMSLCNVLKRLIRLHWSKGHLNNQAISLSIGKEIACSACNTRAGLDTFPLTPPLLTPNPYDETFITQALRQVILPKGLTSAQPL